MKKTTFAKTLLLPIIFAASLCCVGAFALSGAQSVLNSSASNEDSIVVDGNTLHLSGRVTPSELTPYIRDTTGMYDIQHVVLDANTIFAYSHSSSSVAPFENSSIRTFSSNGFVAMFPTPSDTDNLFKNATSLESVFIKFAQGIYDTRSTLDSWFEGCTNLKQVQLSTVTKSEQDASGYLFWPLYSTNCMFKGCQSLKEVNLGDFVDPKLTPRWKYASEMFSGCTSLQIVDLSGLGAGSSFTLKNDGMWQDCSPNIVKCSGLLFQAYSSSTVNFTVPEGSYDCYVEGEKKDSFTDGTARRWSLVWRNIPWETNVVFAKPDTLASATFYGNGGYYESEGVQQDSYTVSGLFGDTIDDSKLPKFKSPEGRAFKGWTLQNSDDVLDDLGKYGVNLAYFAKWGDPEAPYVVKSSDGTTLTFQYGEQPSSGDEGTDWWKIEDSYTDLPGWTSSAVVTKVVIDDSVQNYRPTSTAFWFAELMDLATIENLPTLNTSATANMESMFSNCETLESIDVSSFNTGQVQNMNYMFDGCSELASIDVSNFVTTNVEHMSGMFGNCKKLSELDLSNFNTPKLRDVIDMFTNCEELVSLDLSALNTTNFTTTMNWQQAFMGCAKLESLTLGKNATLMTGTGLSGLSGSTDAFWIQDMKHAVSYNTTEEVAVANINAVLDDLASGGSQTFTKASLRLTYDANGGNYGQDADHKDIEEAYLYGNENDVIIKTGEGAFNNTPTPAMTDYSCIGWAASSTGTTDITPSAFPASDTTYYAIWQPNEAVWAAYANNTLTFSYGDKPEGDTNVWQVKTYTARTPWATAQAQNITKVVIASSLSSEGYKPTNMAWWFEGLNKVTTFEGLNNIDSSSLTNLTSTFSGLTSLQSLTIPFSVSASANLTNIFSGSSSLKTLDLSSVSSTTATTMTGAFTNLSALESLKLPKTFQFANNSGFAFTASATTNFWIADMKTKMGDATNWNNYLASLADTASPHTFTRANITLTYNAGDGHFAEGESVKTAYLYGDEGDTISKTEAPAFDNTPIPVRENYNYSGYIPAGQTEVNTPTTFPNADTTYNAKWTQSAYVLKSTDGKTLTMTFGAQPSTGEEDTDWWKVKDEYTSSPDWSSNTVTSFVFDDSVNTDAFKPTSTAFWFYDLQRLSTITGLSKVKTTELLSTKAMFYNCRMLTSLDCLNNFSTSHVQNMENIFKRCNFTTISLPSSFSSASLENMQGMFMECRAVSSISFPEAFDTSHVTNMSSLFENCNGLKTVKLSSKFEVISGCNTESMFNYITSLESFTAPKSFQLAGTMNFPLTASATSNFWIASIDRRMGDLTDWNNYLKALDDKDSPHTFTRANIALTYNANGGNYGQGADGKDITAAYRYGNAGEKIIDGETDNTPKPTREDYDCIGFAATASATTPQTPTVFPQAGENTTFYAVWGQSAYVTKSADGKTLTMIYGAQPEGEENTDWWKVEDSYTTTPGWSSNTVASFVFDDSVENANFKPTSTAHWLQDLESVTTISGLSKVNTSELLDTSYMFNLCSSLVSLDCLTGFSTTHVQNMDCMFMGCDGLITVSLPASFDTSATDTMAGMFSLCFELKSLTLPSKFDTSSVTVFEQMFQNCSSLTTLNLSANFDMQANTSAVDMFTECSALSSITMPKTFVFDDEMNFPLTATETSNFWVASIDRRMGDADDWNAYLEALSADDSPHTFTRANITLTFNAKEGQYGVDSQDQPIKLAYLYGNANQTISEGDLPVATRDGWGFGGYSDTDGGQKVTIDKFPAANKTYYALYTQAAWMLYNGTNTLTMSFGAKPTPAEGQSVWQVADDYSATKLPEWNAVAANVTSVTLTDSLKGNYQPINMAYWFSGLSSQSVQISGFDNLDTSKVTTMEGTFKNYGSATAPTTSAFNTTNVENMSSLFEGCSKIAALNLSNFNTQKVKTFKNMFKGCSTIETLNVSAFKAATALTTAEAMFSGMSALKTLNVSGLVLPASVTTTNMFANTNALNTVSFAKGFTFGTQTGFAFGGTTTSNFWIAAIDQKMANTYDKWNTYLENLPESETAHTFTIATITYTFKGNGGVFAAYKSASEVSLYGNPQGSMPASALPVASRLGWDSTGWWTAASGGSKVTVPTTFPAQATTTVYAQWSRDTQYAEVSFNSNGGSTVASVMVKKGESVAAPDPAPTRENATFVYWAKDTGLNEAWDFNSVVQSDMTLYARWSAANPNTDVTVIFDSNGGSFVQSQIIAKNTSPTRPDAPTRADGNATFVRWNSDTALTNAFVFPTNVSEDTTLYASWQATSGNHMVTFDSNGGSAIDQQVVADGALATQPADPTRANATFAGWYANQELSSAYVWQTPVTSDITLYADWSATTGFAKVQFATNGGTPVDMQIVAIGASAKEPAPAPVLANATLSGWYVTDTFEGSAYDFSTAVNADLLLYANWQANAGYYKVLFNSAGGSHVDSQIVAAGATASVPSPAPTRENATFSAWCADTALETTYDFTTPVQSNLILYARWSGSGSYITVTFNPNGGSFVGQQIIAPNTKATAPSNPTRSGAIFKYWSDKNDLSTTFSFDTLLSADTTLYARWAGSDADNTIVVSFDSNGGSFVQSQVITKNTSPQKPTNPSRASVVFDGWYSDASLQQVFVWPTNLSVDTVLYAKWKGTASVHVVTFDSMGGSQVDQATVQDGQVLTKPTNPTREHATFSAWYTTAQLGSAYDWTKAVSADFTLYAGWQADAGWWQVTFNSNGGTQLNSQIVQSGQTATEPTPAPSREHATFSAWYNNVDLAGDAFSFTTPITNNITLYADWTADAGYYKVSFNSAGGSHVDMQIVAAGATASAPSPAPVRENAIFRAWCSDTALESTYAFSTPVRANLTLYARWSAAGTYMTVTFNPNGGSFVGQQIVARNARAVAPSNPTRSGATFKYWSLDKNLATSYDFNTAVTSDITLYARWAGSDAANTVAVLFDSNGGSFVPSQIVTIGGYASAPATPGREHAVFNAWYNTSALQTEFNFTQTPITEETTLYAGWSALQGYYTVTFNTNGGSAVTQAVVAANATVTKPADPVRTGADFAAWYSDSDLSTTYNFSSPVTANITLYADWTAKAGFYKVTFNSNGGSLVDMQFVAAGGYAEQPSPNPSRANANFNAWCTDTALASTFDFMHTAITGSTTLYARWVAADAQHVVVTYNPNGGSFIGQDVIAKGAVPTKPTQQPTRADANFVWWSKDVSLGKEYPFTEALVSDLTLYARWKGDDTHYAVIFDSNGGSFVETQIVAAGASATRPAEDPVLEHATFDNWYQDAALKTAYAFGPVQSETTVYARWNSEAGYATVTFDSNGGSFVGQQVVALGSSATRPAAPTLKDATFDTWCEDTALTSAYDFGPVTEDVVVYARWKAADQTTHVVVTFNPNGGSFVGQQIVKKGEKTSKPTPDPVLDKAQFSAWCSDKNLSKTFDFANTAITEDTTLYASWSATSGYMVTFNAMGGSFVNSERVDAGAYATKPTPDPIHKDGTFSEWCTDETLSTAFDFANTAITSNITLYAKYTWNSYTVVFNANGLTFSDGSTQKSLSIAYGSRIVAPALSVPADKDFLGWYTEPAAGQPMPYTCVGPATYYAHSREARKATWMSLDNGVLSLSYGTHPTDAEHFWEVVGPYSETDPAPWDAYATSIMHARIDASVKEAPKPTSVAYWYANLPNLQSIEGMPYLNTENVASFKAMFKGASSLQNLDMAKLSMKSATDISNMLEGCSSLNAADLSGFDFTKNTVNTENVFSGCASLAALRLPSTYAQTGQSQTSYPVSSEWEAYKDGQKQEGTDFSDVSGWLSYLNTHPGITSFIKEGKVASVVFYANGGNFEDTTGEKVVSGKAGLERPTAPEAPSKEGYTFVGWATTPDAASSDMPATLPLFGFGPLSYYAIWQKISPVPPTPSETPGWHHDEGGWWYVHQDGTYCRHGWEWVDDIYGAHWYYFYSDGYMAYSTWFWDEGNSSWYWVCSSGPMIQGLWQWIDNQWYGFWWNGKMCRGWVWDSAWQEWFYCFGNGVMARNGWWSWYYFNWQGIWIH